MEEEDAEAEAAEGMTQLAASRSVPASSSFGNIADISPVLALGRSLILVSSQVPQEMMHEGWEPERQRWEDATRASRSVQDIGNALAHLEDWIALDYAPGSDMVNIDAWSRRVRAVTGLDEMHQAVQAFERNVFWAVQNEDRLKQTSRTRGLVRTARSPTVAEVATSSMPAASTASQAATGGSKQGKKDRQHGRWGQERYEGAVGALVAILKRMQATRPDACVLRPALREEARKAVGDTGLLDHLLKHLADRVVTPEGDKLRRRHNAEGHMEYWLQSAADAAAEEDGMLEEATGLSADYREVRRLRRLLSAARAEATGALADAQGAPAQAPGTPRQPGQQQLPGKAASPPASPGGDAAESACGQCRRLKQQLEGLQARVAENESAAAAEFEEVRRESNGFVQLLASHVRSAGLAAEGALQRVAALERATAQQQQQQEQQQQQAAAAVARRSSSPSGLHSLSEEVGRQGEVLRLLQEELSTVKKGVLTLHSSLWQTQQRLLQPPAVHAVAPAAPQQAPPTPPGLPQSVGFHSGAATILAQQQQHPISREP